jgi:hypothetical protein
MVDAMGDPKATVFDLTSEPFTELNLLRVTKLFALVPLAAPMAMQLED